jgi:type II secretion system protein N
MPPDTTPKPPRWQLGLAYGAFALVAFFVCLALTFPYDTLRARIVSEAAAAGYAVRIGSLRPGLRGVTATDVRVSKPSEPLSPETLNLLMSGGSGGVMPGPAELGEPLTLSSVAMRPSLLPLGVSLHADALGGTISGAVGGLGALKVRLHLEDLDTTQGNLKGFSGMDLEGRLAGDVRLDVPRDASPTGRNQLDFTGAQGTIALDGSQLLIKGGTATVPLYGQPTKVDLPRIALGDVDIRLAVDKGLGTLEALSAKSEDLEVKGGGTVKFAKTLPFSELAMDVKVKAEPAFTQRLGILGSALTILPMDRAEPGFRSARLSGYLSNPKFLPAR